MGDFFEPWHLAVLTVVFLPIAFITILPYWLIFKKAGFAPALSLLTVVPFVGLVVLFIVAFSDWPALRGLQSQTRWNPPA